MLPAKRNGLPSNMNFDPSAYGTPLWCLGFPPNGGHVGHVGDAVVLAAKKANATPVVSFMAVTTARSIESVEGRLGFRRI